MPELKNEKVSVIVPVCRVEKYIEQCIISLIRQTYSNIEIIAVDDGSPDRCGKILGELAEKEKRLRVIHKENGGVSSARNAGMDSATGDYIVFVDGDDYVSEDYIEYLLELARSGADFCFSKYWFKEKGEKQTETDEQEIMTAEDAAAYMLLPYMVVYSPNKIFKRSFLEENSLRFSENLFYGEGFQFVMSAVQRANFAAAGERKIYYYRRNNESSACTVFNIEKFYNGEKAIDKIDKEIVKRTKKIDERLILHRSVFRLGAVVQTKSNGLEKVYADDCRRWIKYVRDNIFIMLKSKYVSNYRKLMLLAGCFCSDLLAVLYKKRRINKRKNSI